MSVAESQGILLIALDSERDLKHALNLAVSIRANDPFANIALIHADRVIDSPTDCSPDKVAIHEIFDFLIPCPDNILHWHDKKSMLWPRFYAYELSPFTRTLYLDVKNIILPGKRPTDLLDQLKGCEYALSSSGTYSIDGDQNLKRIKLKELISTFGRYDADIDEINDFVEYFERSKDNQRFYSLARQIAADIRIPSLSDGNGVLHPSTVMTLAAYQMQRKGDITLGLAFLCHDSFQTIESFSHQSVLAYAFTENDSEAAFDYCQQAADAYSKPRDLVSMVSPLSKTGSGSTKSWQHFAQTEIPALSTPSPFVQPPTPANIPYDVHQIWINLDGSNGLPDRYIPMVNSWFTQSDHHHTIHSHQDLIDLLTEDYPQFLDFYHQATYITEKSDICRYLLMHKYGGVYVDADMVCLKSLAPLLATLKKPICMCLEPPQHRFWDRVLLGSAFIASEPGLPIWIELVAFMQKYYKPNSFPVLTTGPIIVDYFLHSKAYKPQIEILDSQYMFPADTSMHANAETKASFCRHEWTGLDTWLAQVPLGVRRTLYAKEHEDLESLHNYMNEALDPENTDFVSEEQATEMNIQEHKQQLEYALREAQTVVADKDEIIQELRRHQNTHSNHFRDQENRIDKLNRALKKAQQYTLEKESQIQRIDQALREAQDIVEERNDHVQRLELALREAQAIVKEQQGKIDALDKGLQEAQAIVKTQNEQIQTLDTALKEAQKFAWERASEIELLNDALEKERKGKGGDQ